MECSNTWLYREKVMQKEKSAQLLNRSRSFKNSRMVEKTISKVYSSRFIAALPILRI